jgi:hypothetical protein
MNDAAIRFADWQAIHGITTLKKRGLTPFIRSDGVLCLQGKHESSIYPLSDDHEIARRAARIIVERETRRNHAGETRPTI